MLLDLHIAGNLLIVAGPRRAVSICDEMEISAMHQH